MENKKSFELYVKDKVQNNACKLIRPNDGELQVEFKMKSNDKKVPPYIRIDAVEVVDQITAAMNQEERMLAYTKLMLRLRKFKTLS